MVPFLISTKHYLPFANTLVYMSQPPHTGGGLPRPAELDPLHAYGFVLDHLSPHKASGHLLVTSKCCQESFTTGKYEIADESFKNNYKTPTKNFVAFGVLHGGVSAMIAEDLASYGGLASANSRTAGVQLSINHLKTAVIGDLLLAEATPIKVGKSLQVWNVRIEKCDPSNTEIKTLISISTVTMFCNFTESQHDKDIFQRIKEYAKL